MRTRSDLSTTQGNLSFLLPMFIDLRVPDYFPRRRLLSLRLGDSIWKDGSFTCVFLFVLMRMRCLIDCLLNNAFRFGISPCSLKVLPFAKFFLSSSSVEHVTEKKEALGEVLNGDRLVDAPYELNFREDKQSKSLCKKHMSKEDVTKFRNAISKNYYFQMFYDDLPLWGFFGRIDKNKVGSYENKYLLFKHIQFDILYNDDRVIEISIQPDPTMLVDISEDKEVDVDFTYSVTWKKTGIPFEKRMEKYSKVSSMPQHLEIHWFSIVNSCVIVLLLTSFLATILMRVLKNDFIR
ncbi:hypothetical protein BHM03_00031176 [Ensete ventricosum]|nr:hypothetical protein BHM03_00031176 [Ensete ventricosum]